MIGVYEHFPTLESLDMSAFAFDPEHRILRIFFDNKKQYPLTPMGLNGAYFFGLDTAKYRSNDYSLSNRCIQQ